jgi:hypothetical protein
LCAVLAQRPDPLSKVSYRDGEGRGGSGRGPESEKWGLRGSNLGITQSEFSPYPSEGPSIDDFVTGSETAVAPLEKRRFWILDQDLIRCEQGDDGREDLLERSSIVVEDLTLFVAVVQEKNDSDRPR